MSVDEVAAVPSASVVAHADPRDAVVASRIAAELRCNHAGGRQRLSKVSSLLHSFRGGREANPSTDEVAAALNGAGVKVSPPLPAARRVDCVRLTLADEPDADARAAQPTVRVSVWRKGAHSSNVEFSVDMLDQDERTRKDRVLWFQVELPAPPLELDDALEIPGSRRWRRLTEGSSAPRPATASRTHSLDKDLVAADLLNELGPWCVGLQLGMIRDLLTEDSQPTVQLYGSEQTGVRCVSTVAAVATTVPRPGGDDASTATHLLMQTVESVVGDGWLITAWHPSRLNTGAGAPRPGPALLREPFIGYTHHHWLQGSELTTSGDLGIYLAHSLTNTYDASHRMLERWADSWEVDFNRQLRHSDELMIDAATASLSDLMSIVGDLQRKVSAFQNELYATADRCWFPRLHDAVIAMPVAGQESTSDEVRQLMQALQSVKEKLELLFTGLRDNMNLMMLYSLQAQQKSGRDFQRKLEKVTALLLVPTLIAGIFGANTAIPGAGNWLGFAVMLLLMLVSAAVVYGVMQYRSETAHRS